MVITELIIHVMLNDAIYAVKDLYVTQFNSFGKTGTKCKAFEVLVYRMKYWC